MSTNYTLIDPEGRTVVDVTKTGSRLEVAASSLAAATGWTVKPEGFCKADICVPAGDAVRDGRVDLIAFAQRLARPIVVDHEVAGISLGAAAADRANTLQSLKAPDFTLPDLTGKLHSLSDYRGKKVLLATYASW